MATPLVVADLSPVYATITKMQIALGSTFPELCDKRHNAAHQNRRVIKIPTIDNNVDVTDYTRHADYGTATRQGISYTDFTLDQYRQVNGEISFLDEEELYLGLAENMRSAQGLALLQDEDANALTFLDAATVAASRDLQSTLTTVNNVWDVSLGKYGSAVGKLIYEQIVAFGDAMASIGATSETAGGDVPTDLYALLSIHQLRTMLNWLFAQKQSLDPLTENILVEAKMLRASGRVRGVVNNVSVIAWPRIKEPTSGTADRPFYMGAKQAVAWSDRPVWVNNVPASANETKPSQMIRQINRFGRMVLQPELLYKGGVQTVA